MRLALARFVDDVRILVHTHSLGHLPKALSRIRRPAACRFDTCKYSLYLTTQDCSRSAPRPHDGLFVLTLACERLSPPGTEPMSTASARSNQRRGSGQHSGPTLVGTISGQGVESLITLAQALPLLFPTLAPAPTTRLHQSAATILRTVIRRTITTVPSTPPNDSVCAYATAAEKKTHQAERRG
jgi:hypothetical protein